ncbi:Dor1-domain-containing protein [Xylaria bambusicola]|uniref:Dor1-domain-containing protein n=1 Tax=Xylaria bambusicola TaxID=326684 RepID=UPI00200792A2|nr:Dor1-domain-containing protein [Xylaria bambusicola]KAI0526097.1 Dor1-domain-containing protein [Xylaria bambusicola]
MADLLYDLLTPSLSPDSRSSPPDPVALEYLTKLAAQPLEQLETVEPQTLAQSSHSLLLSLQGLSQRSHKTIISSSESHASLGRALPALATSISDLKAVIPKLDDAAVRFSTTYHKSADNELLKTRKTALLLSRNVERVVDLLDLPTLLSSAIATSSSSLTANYASALDLNNHIRRLHTLHPDSSLVSAVAHQADEAMQLMAKNLISSLRTPSLKLTAALRTISWLKRVAPDLSPSGNISHNGAGDNDGLGALFLICRLSTLMNMLQALEPLRELADKERLRQQQNTPASGSWSGGQQTERYLKRYIEIFREQSFAIVSMFKSVFPPQASKESSTPDGRDPLQSMPSMLSTFPLHIIEMLVETLRIYLPNVRDQASRDSLLTQVLYCAGSLGRLGGDFGILLASLDLGENLEDEWVEVVRRHRLMAGRLESIPFDLLKTRVQQSGTHSIRSAVREIARSPNVVAAFWRGTVPSALRTGMGSAIYFTTLNTIRQQASALAAQSQLHSQNQHNRPSSSALPKLSNTTNLLSGAFARAFAGFILMPLTVIKVRYESSMYSYASVIGAARDIYRTGRISGFFAGFGATAMRDAPYAGLYVVSYEQFKKRLGQIYGPGETHHRLPGTGMAGSVSATINFSSGALAGATCSFISNPFDAVKTRIQLQPHVYRNMFHACQMMVTREGVRSLYDGLALRMTRKALSSALAWMMYEELIRRAESTWQRDTGGHV